VIRKEDKPEEIDRMKITNTPINLFDAFLIAAFFILIGWQGRRHDEGSVVRIATKPVTDETSTNGVSSATETALTTETALNRAGYTGRRLIPFNIKEKTK
jgi:hypothetical protein